MGGHRIANTIIGSKRVCLNFLRGIGIPLAFYEVIKSVFIIHALSVDRSTLIDRIYPIFPEFKDQLRASSPVKDALPRSYI